MKEKPTPSSSDNFDPFGAREVLRLTIEKLQSQILLFGLALVVVMFVGWRFIGNDGAMLLGGVLLVFSASLGAYVFVTTRQELVDDHPPQSVPHDLNVSLSETEHSTNILGRIINDDASFELHLWVSKVEEKLEARAESGGGSRNIVVEAVGSGDDRPRHSKLYYHIGDHIRVHVEASQDCYLTLLNVGSKGDLTVVYPNNLHEGNFLRGNQTITIPADNDRFQYQLAGPAGLEQLKAIATREPLAILPEDLTDAGEIFRTAAPVPGARAIAVVAKEVEGLSRRVWNEATLKFEVVN